MKSVDNERMIWVGTGTGRVSVESTVFAIVVPVLYIGAADSGVD